LSSFAIAFDVLLVVLLLLKIDVGGAIANESAAIRDPHVKCILILGTLRKRSGAGAS
jgi:hypothetical protein